MRPGFRKRFVIAGGSGKRVTEFRFPILWSGSLQITRFTPRGSVTEYIPNLIVNVGLNLMRDALRGAVTDAEIKYVALGTDATPPAAGNTTLVAEVFRKAVAKAEAGAAGVTTTTFYIAPYEGNYAVEEIGFFAGVTATSAPDSGVLVARVLYSRAKTELESWQIVRTDTFAPA